jgi:lipopolysaccharide transport system ATP-binding protein
MSDQLLVSLVGVGKQYPSGSASGLRALLSKRGSDRPWALAPMSLDIRAGQSVAILGRNGSGKSTLLGIAAGTISPTVGLVDRRVDPTLLFQVGTAFDEELSGAENTRLELLLRGSSGRGLKAHLEDAREFSEIGEAWEEPLRTYSSGMRARTALAAALADPGELVFVDEILAVGDVGFVAKCIDRFRTLRASGTSVVFVSHDASIANALADEAIVLDHGRVVASGLIADALTAYAAITNRTAA